MGAGEIFQIGGLGAVGLDQRLIGRHGLAGLALPQIGLGDQNLVLLTAGLLGQGNGLVILAGAVIQRRQLASGTTRSFQLGSGFGKFAGAGVNIAGHFGGLLLFFRRAGGGLGLVDFRNGSTGVARTSRLGSGLQRLADRG